MLKKLIDVLKPNSYRIFLLSSIIIGCFPLLWFKGFMISGEEFYAVDYASWARFFSGAWAPFFNYGEPSTLTAFKLQGFVFSTLNIIGSSLYLSLIIWHVILSVLTAVFFYNFVYVLFKNKIHPAILFLGTVSYLLNPFFLNISPLLSPPRLIFVFLPLIAWCFYRYTIQNGTYWLLVLNIILFFATPIFVNIPAGLVILSFIYIFLGYYHIFINRNISKLIQATLIFTTLFLIFNLWWLGPALISILTQVAGIKNNAAGFLAINESRTYDILTLFGSWAFRGKIPGYNYFYFPYYAQYDAVPLLILRFLPVVLFFGALLSLKTWLHTKNRLSEYLLFLSFVYILFLYLSKGSVGVGGSIYNYLFFNFPIFWIFREPYLKFMPIAVFCASIFNVVGIEYFAQLFTKMRFYSAKYLRYFPHALYIFVLGVFLLIGMPLLNGSVVWNINNGKVRSYEIEFSEDWTNLMQKWTPLNKDGNFILYPSKGHSDIYKWKSGYIGNPYLMYKNIATINPESGYERNANVQEIINMLYFNMLNNPNKFLDLVQKYNISGLIFQGDLAYGDFEEEAIILNNHYKSQQVSNFGKINIYEFSNEKAKVAFLPKSTVYDLYGASSMGFVANLGSSEFGSQYLIINDSIESDEVTIPNAYVLPISARYPGLSFLANTYDLSAINKGKYELLLQLPKEKLISATLDNKPLSFVERNGFLYTDINLEDSCCDKLLVNFVDWEEIKLEPHWLVQESPSDVINPDRIYTGNVLPLVSSKVFFKKEVTDFDPQADYEFILEGNYSNPEGFKFLILANDKDSSVTDVIYSRDVDKIIGKKQFSYRYSGRPRINDGTRYYIALSAKAKKDEPRVITHQVNLTGLKAYKVTEPNIVLIANSQHPLENNQNQKVSFLESHKLDNSIWVINIIEPGQQGILQFKESYNKNWRLVNLSLDQFNKLTDTSNNKFAKFNVLSSILFRSFSGKKPLNIEYYSNGWNIDSGNQEYVALVYWPAIFSLVLYPLIFTLVIGLAVYLVFKKFSRKSI